MPTKAVITINEVRYYSFSDRKLVERLNAFGKLSIGNRDYDVDFMSDSYQISGLDTRYNNSLILHLDFLLARDYLSIVDKLEDLWHQAEEMDGKFPDDKWLSDHDFSYSYANGGHYGEVEDVFEVELLGDYALPEGA